MRFDVAIMGGGIVGLSLAYTLLTRNPYCRVLLIEKEPEVGQHQTGHNSGVIHSGIYYRPGSLKAKNCRHGYELMVSFCRKHAIPHAICGKIIVATEEHELVGLEELHRRGMHNGLTGIKKLSPPELREIEPHVAGIAGLLVPQTGIVDFRVVAQTLQKLAVTHGAEFRMGERVESIRQDSSGIHISTSSQTYLADRAVNCAGLFADRLALQTKHDLDLRIIPFRGEYYTLTPERQHLVKSLIYPVPDPAFPFLGVHFTRMISGKVEAGPNAVLALKREGYKKTDFDWRDLWDTVSWPGFRKLARRYWGMGCGEIYRSYCKEAFVRSLQRLVPEITASDLLPGGSGVRAQACDSQGRLLDDFSFVNDGRLLHVCNAPSPAATSALAIGEVLCDQLNKS